MSGPGQPLLDQLLDEIHGEFPGFRLIAKDRSPLSRLIHRTLVILTFGQMRAYLDGYVTTLGQRVYTTPDWSQRDPRDRYITLRHERIHLRQFRKFTVPGMALLYVLLPLPMGFAYFRARFEQEAYAESIRAAAEVYGLNHVTTDSFRERIVSQFTGPSYGWMWPFRPSLERWYDAVVATVRDSEKEAR